MELTLKVSVGQDTCGYPQLMLSVFSEDILVSYRPYTGGEMLSSLFCGLKEEKKESPFPVVEKITENSTRPSAVIQGAIQKGDTVAYCGQPDEEDPDAADLIPGQEYTVLEVKNQTVAILNTESPNPYRLTVLKSDVVLRKKAEPKNKKKPEFEEIVHCPTCKTPNVLTKKAGKYSGKCESCGEKISL